MSEYMVDLDDLAAAIGASSRLDRTEQHLAVSLYRAVGEGRPVSVAWLAQRCGRDASRPGGHAGRLAGGVLRCHRRRGRLLGPRLVRDSHGCATGGRQLYTWCAWDTLFITPILDQVAAVSSSCPVTGRAVRSPSAPRACGESNRLRPSCPSLSPQRPWADDVITTFCHYVLFFASPERGRQWVDGHPGTFLLNMADAFELGCRFKVLRPGPGAGCR